nr:sigma-70 family RNA polymerase sigma factor [Eubacteriales bacterium]
MKNIIVKIIGKLFAKNCCHYINGPDTLPPPLSKEKEQEIMLEIALGDESNKDLLVVHNLRLVVYIAKKYECPTATTEDLVSIGTIGLMKAVNTFDFTKNIKLATYASRCIENEILMYLRKAGNSKIELSFDEPLSTDWDGNEMTLRDVLGTEPDEICQNIEYEDEKKLLRKIVSELSEKEQNIMFNRFGLNGYKPLTQKQLADKLSISQSYISRLEKKIIASIKKEFDKAQKITK